METNMEIYIGDNIEISRESVAFIKLPDLHALT
jgi:hypothetical protein